MTTDNRTNEPTPEQILWELYPDDVMDHNRRANCHLFLEQLRTHGLLSEGAPSEQRVERAARAFFREYHGEDIWPELRDDGELDTRSRALAATRAALTAAGVAPQEPNQNETKSGNNFVSLDPEKVDAQGVAPQVESDERIQAWERLIQHPVWRCCFEEERPLIDSVMERIDNLAELEMTVNELAPAPVLPSSGVDEDKLAEVIARSSHRATDSGTNPRIVCADPAEVARAVAEWLKGQGGESSGA